MNLFTMKRKKVVIVRQRPSIGDAILLEPLIEAVKEKYPDNPISVITDSSYAKGALGQIFQMFPEVEEVVNVSPLEWTTESNKRIEPYLNTDPRNMPLLVKKAEAVYDCNGQFMEYERDVRGAATMGIAEFWLRLHEFNSYADQPENVLPFIVPPLEARQRLFADMEAGGYLDKPLVGVILRAGDPVRDWNYQNKASLVCDYLWSCGMQPITIDPTIASPSAYALSCVGKDLHYVAALLERCAFVLTPDTGLLHMAQAVGTRTLALWGIMPPKLRTKDYNTRIIPEECLGYCTRHELENCQCPWKFQQWSCLRRIQLKDIINAIDKEIQCLENQTVPS